MTSVESQLRIELSWLQSHCEPWGTVAIEEITREDHIHAKRAYGLSICGTALKLRFTWKEGETFHHSYFYFYPSGSFQVGGSIPPELWKEFGNWLNWLHAVYNEDAHRSRCLRRTEDLKEELIAAAWAPQRIATALEAGQQLEDM